MPRYKSIKPITKSCFITNVFSYHSRGLWYEEYDDYEEDQEDLDEDEVIEVPHQSDLDRFEDGFRTTVFGDSSANYATSLDCRNTIDLREIGLESEQDTFFALKSGQTTRLNITSNMAAGRNNMVASQHHQQQHQHQPGWSKKSSFNFRFTDKSQSAPSLPCCVSESAYHDNLSSYSPFGSSKTTVFENYTRVTSVPVDLNLCGSSTQDVLESCEENDIEMADVTVIQEEDSRSPLNTQIKKANESFRKSLSSEDLFKEEESMKSEILIDKEDSAEKCESPKVLQSSVRTQDPQSVDTKQLLAFNDTPNCQEEEDLPLEEKPVTSTVKTQDRTENVLDIAMALENDVNPIVDEAIKQFKREVEEATAAGNASEVITAMETVQRIASIKQRPKRVKNNASYELAQQFEVNDINLRPLPSCQEDNEPKPNLPRRSGSGRRVLNNASYELAQQCDYIKALQSTKPFLRMNACDELEESKVPDLLHKMEGRHSRDEKHQDDSFINQIKKNSDLYSVYGEEVSYGEEIRCRLDDEVDYPCLENKPIQCPEQGLLKEIPKALKEGLRRKKSFISEFYPEKTRRDSLEEDGETVNDEKGARSSESDQKVIVDTSGERLWKVVVEKQSEKEKITGLSSEEGEKRSEESERGQSSQSAGSPPPVALESQPSSGNPVVAVAVDRNQGRVCYNDNSEDKRPVLSEMSTVAKRLAGASTTKGDALVTMIPERKKSGLGGFLQRFSKLRFSGRSKVPRSEVQKKSEQVQQVSRVRAEEPQKRKQEPDYIIIPLHPTEDERRAEEIRKKQVDATERTGLKRPAEVDRSASSVR